MELDNNPAILADIHNHSTLSPDGFDEPFTMAQRACGLGIKHFALTDHIECEKLSSWDYLGAAERSFGIFSEIKRKFSGETEFYYGVELGQPLYNPDFAEQLLAEHDYDYVLGSSHRTKSYGNLTKIPDTDEDRQRMLDEYFVQELELAEWGKFSALAHLTFPLRFICGDFGGHEVDMSRYRTIIDKILETIIKSGIALEVNSSGIRKGLHLPMPNEEYIRRYFELGGRMITVGSDAHRASDVGADIPQVMRLLRSIGFSEICIFKKRQPVFLAI